MSVAENMVLVSWLVPVVLLVGCVIGSYGIRSLGSRHKVTLLFLAAALLIDLVSRYLGFVAKSENNLVMLSVSALVDLTFFGWVYTRHFFMRRRILLEWLIGILAICIVLRLLIFPTLPEFQFQAYERLSVDVFLLYLSLLFLKDSLIKGEGAVLRDRYANAVFLVYVVIDLFVALTANFMVNASVILVAGFWLIRLLTLVVMYSNLSYGLWKNGR